MHTFSGIIPCLARVSVNGLRIVRHTSGNILHIADLPLSVPDLLLLPLKRRQHTVHRIGNACTSLRILIYAGIYRGSSHFKLCHIGSHFTDQIHQASLHFIKCQSRPAGLIPAFYLNIFARQVPLGHNCKILLQLYDRRRYALHQCKSRRQNNNRRNYHRPNNYGKRAPEIVLNRLNKHLASGYLRCKKCLCTGTDKTHVAVHALRRIHSGRGIGIPAGGLHLPVGSNKFTRLGGELVILVTHLRVFRLLRKAFSYFRHILLHGIYHFHMPAGSNISADPAFGNNRSSQIGGIVLHKCHLADAVKNLRILRVIAV